MHIAKSHNSGRCNIGLCLPVLAIRFVCSTMEYQEKKLNWVFKKATNVLHGKHMVLQSVGRIFPNSNFLFYVLYLSFIATAFCKCF